MSDAAIRVVALTESSQSSKPLLETQSLPFGDWSIDDVRRTLFLTMPRQFPLLPQQRETAHQLSESKSECFSFPLWNIIASRAKSEESAYLPSRRSPAPAPPWSLQLVFYGRAVLTWIEEPPDLVLSFSKIILAIYPASMVHVIHKWAWDGTPNEGAASLQVQWLDDNRYPILLIPVLGGVVSVAFTRLLAWFTDTFQFIKEKFRIRDVVCPALGDLGTDLIALTYLGNLHWEFTNVDEKLCTRKIASAPSFCLAQLASAKVVGTTLCKGSDLVGGSCICIGIGFTGVCEGLGDFMVMRSKEQSVYNFCVAVDDDTMAISHVVRAEEHFPNTLRQAWIYKALEFFQFRGTFHNYYMYHGGTNFGCSAGGPFITTSYAYDVLIDEYGLVRQPRWGHLKDVHKAIKFCEETMVESDPKTTSFGSSLEGTVYQTAPGKRIVFLANVNTKSDTIVMFNGNSYNLPAWSVSILPDWPSMLQKINSMSTILKFIRQSSEDDAATIDAFASWSWIIYPVVISGGKAFTRYGLLEQINKTADLSEYLWYSLSIETKDGSKAVLYLDSLGHALNVFINGKLEGSGKGRNSDSKVLLVVPISFVLGKNNIDLLSLIVGLQNYRAFFDLKGVGFTGVKLKEATSGFTIDLSSSQRTHQIGLKGDELGLYTGSSALWTPQPTLSTNQSIVWYESTISSHHLEDKVNFEGEGNDTPNGQELDGSLQPKGDMVMDRPKMKFPGDTTQFHPTTAQLSSRTTSSLP